MAAGATVAETAVPMAVVMVVAMAAAEAATTGRRRPSRLVAAAMVARAATPMASAAKTTISGLLLRTWQICEPQSLPSCDYTPQRSRDVRFNTVLHCNCHGSR